MICRTLRTVAPKRLSRWILATLLSLLGGVRGEAQVTATWIGTTGDMATASNWSTGAVPAGSAGTTMQFDGSGVSTLSFPGATFGGSPGLGGLIVTADQTAALGLTNSGGALSPFRLGADAGLTIAAGAGAFSFGVGGNTVQLTVSNLGSGNRLTNNSANTATLGPQVLMAASTGVNGLAIFDGSGDWLVSGTVGTGLSRGITKEGAGTLTLAAANTFTGTTTVTGGTLLLAHADALASSQVATGGLSFDAGVTPAAFSFGSLSGSGSISLQNTNADAVALTVGGSNASTTFSGVLSGSGSLVKTGTGSFTITVPQTYAGGTTVGAGTLILSGSTQQLPTGTLLNVASGATMRITGLGGSTVNSEIVGGLQGSGTVTTTNGATAVRLTIRNDSNYTFAGSFTGGATLRYFKEGTGTQTLTGASTNSGQWDITAGRLRIENGAALGDAVGSTWIGSPFGSEAVLDLAGGISSAEPLNLSGRATAGAATRVANASGANTLTGPITLNVGGLFYGIASDAGSLRIEGAVSQGNAGGTRTLVLGGAATGEIAGGINGSGFTLGLEKQDAGTWTISSTSSHSGPTTIAGGTLLVSGSLTSTSAMTVNAGGVLGGSGSVGVALAGAGLVSPGSSPGILTAPQVDPSAGTSYAFEFTGTGSPAYGNATASINDVLRLTDLTTPFTTNLTAGNVIDVYFDMTTLSNGDTFRGGFYTDQGTDFLTAITDASYAFWVLGDGSGNDRVFNGQSFYSLASFDSSLSVTRSTVAEAADFGSGTVNGQVTQFVVVPEPGVLALLAAGMSLVAGSLWTRRKPGVAFDAGSSEAQRNL